MILIVFMICAYILAITMSRWSYSPVISILIIPILIGIIIRVIAKNKPKTEFLIWAILMTILLFFFAYSLVLVINQETALFTKNHLANEFTVIGTAFFLISGYIYFIRNKKKLPGGHD